jgi:hypothetical protein
MSELEIHPKDLQKLTSPTGLGYARVKPALKPIYYADNEASLGDILSGRCTRIKKAYKFTPEEPVNVTIHSCTIEVQE